MSYCKGWDLPTDGSAEVVFESRIVRIPPNSISFRRAAHARYEVVHISIEKGGAIKLGSLETSNDPHDLSYIVSGCHLQVGAIIDGTDRPEPRHVCGTPVRRTLHDRRSEVYSISTEAVQRVMHFMGQPEDMRHIRDFKRGSRDFATVVRSIWDPHWQLFALYWTNGRRESGLYRMMKVLTSASCSNQIDDKKIDRCWLCTLRTAEPQPVKVNLTSGRSVSRVRRWLQAASDRVIR